LTFQTILKPTIIEKICILIYKRFISASQDCKNKLLKPMTIYQTVQSTTDAYLQHNAIGHSYNTPLEKSSKIRFYLIIDIYNLAALTIK
jgi:hypothetical protein